MRFIRAKDMTIPPRAGVAPPQRPVPAPRGTIGSPSSLAMRTIALTSRASFGRTAAEGNVSPLNASNE